jgi:hypothetical protein
MVTRISDAARNAAANGVVDLLDGGAAAGYIEIRTGTQPASVATAASGTLLGTLPLSDPAFGDSVGGTATAGAITSDTSADASGVAGWFRAYDSNAVAVIDGSAGEAGTDLILDNASIVAGGTIAVSSWTVTMPAG